MDVDQKGELSCTELAQRFAVSGVIFGDADFQRLVNAGLPARLRRHRSTGSQKPADREVPATLDQRAKLNRDLFRQVKRFSLSLELLVISCLTS